MDIFQAIGRMVEHAESLDEFQKAVSEGVSQLEEKGMMEEALTIKELSKVQVNRFSRLSTYDVFISSKKQVSDYLNHQGKREADLIKVILENFHVYCKKMYRTKPHTKCSEKLKEHLCEVQIENEYDLQHLLYPLIRAVFPDARVEEAQDTGHHMVRKDIVVDSQDAVIELKCSRASMTERQLSEEVASDIIHYSNRCLYFYIYDKCGIIENGNCFKSNYEQKKVDGKEIYLVILQHNEI